MYRKLDEAALGTILEAGIAEFARCGFQPASISAVARAARVGRVGREECGCKRRRDL